MSKGYMNVQKQPLNSNEFQRKLAEDSRKLAEEARALADKAYADKMGLSPEQFVRLESIKAGERMVAECNKSGKGGCNILVGAGANAQPMMQMKGNNLPHSPPHIVRG